MIERSKEWWLALAESEGDSEVGAGVYKELDIEETIRQAKYGFSEANWAKGEQFVIDYYYKPGACTSFVHALEMSPHEVDDYVNLAQMIAGILDAKDKELMRALVKSQGWNPECESWSMERIMEHISYRTERKYTASDVSWAKMIASNRNSEYNKGLKAELVRQQVNYGKLSNKYAALKAAFRAYRKAITG
jgi:hypothetical protein